MSLMIQCVILQKDSKQYKIEHMSSELPFLVLELLADGAFLLFVTYYFLRLRTKEKTFDEKEKRVDADYHKVVDSALAKERKILEDASTEAELIIASAQYVSEASKERINQALQQMVTDIQKEATNTSRTFMNNYSANLQRMSATSQNEFQAILKTMQADLQKQITDFRQTKLPNLERELDSYKQTRMQEIEKTVEQVVQKTAQEVLNKSISLEDHHNLIVDSLEKAKKEGILN
jgi:F0F1-type ATP synthase membrane subunit b/b'